MKLTFTITAVLFFFSLQLVAQQHKSSVELHGTLRIEGNRMINKDGIPPQLRGISLSWSLWGGKKYYNPEVIDWLTKDFNITLLRASMGVQPEGGYLKNRDEQMNLMTTVIDQSIKNGIYVLIDWHDHNADQHLEESKAFFAIMAKKYAGIPNVIYEIFNEPAQQNWDVIKTYSVEVIKTIRQYDSKNVIVVGSPRWDQDVDIAAADPIKGFNNLVYSFHFYASDPNHQEKLRAKAELAMTRGIALFVTEWGVGESNGDGEFNREKTAVWMNWMEKNRLSWANWNLTDKKETTALLMPGASVNGGWSDGNLTEAGRYIREQLRMKQLKSEVYKNLTENILPYWTKNMVDSVNGGFYGRIDYQEMKYPEYDKGGILWTFSSAYRITKDTSCLSAAKRARDYILDHFIDQKYGGTYRSVNSKGKPSDLRKQTYSQSFFIYALSEYFRATGDQEALIKAKEIFMTLENYAVDPKSDGYFEIFDREWNRTNDLIIGEKNSKDEKTMNTHLHLMEAYSNLYSVWPDPKVAVRLKNLISIFTNKIIDPQTFHLKVFLDNKWQSTSTINSYGHEIEAFWLLVEAAQILGDQILLKNVEKISLRIADAASEGLQPDGSLINEKDYSSGDVNDSRDWWPQAEAIVGLMNAFELSGKERYLNDAIKCWNYTNQNLVDHKSGEWFNAISASGTVSKGDKAGFWKCPYHNGGMCMEIIERVSKIEN